MLLYFAQSKKFESNTLFFAMKQSLVNTERIDQNSVSQHDFRIFNKPVCHNCICRVDITSC